MAAKRGKGRPRKSALNQEKETKVTVSEKDVEKMNETHDMDLLEEAKKMASEKYDVPVEEVKVEVVPEEEVETPEEEKESPEQPIEVKEEEVKEEEVKPTRKVSDLSPDEYRYYMNTGKIL